MPAYYLEALVVAIGFIILLMEAFIPSNKKGWAGIVGAAGLVGVLVMTFFAIGPEKGAGAGWTTWPLWNFYVFDGMARFYKIFALIATILVLLMTVDFRKVLSRYTEDPETEEGTGEFYSLVVFACAGMMWMASAKDLAGAFVALELVTITFYILVTFMRRNIGSLEAGVKYLILGALSTGFLVYGIAWVYGSTGTMQFDGFPQALAGLGNPIPLLFGIALILVALGFKVGAVPMQLWIPDVYQGSPTPTTAFLSIGSKAAGFALLIRFISSFVAEGSPVRIQVLTILMIVAVATLIFGNLAAIPQGNFKRLLAYSSIAHAGFLLLALAAWLPETATSIGSIKTICFYLATYLLMTMGVFFILAQVRAARGGEAISDFNGLGKSNPALAFAMTILLAALAGVPLTAGFLGKFFVFSLAVDAQLWLGLAAAIIGAVAGFYYYFKTIRAMWWLEPSDGPAIQLPIISKVSVIVLTILTIVFGIYPDPILKMMQ